MKEPKDKRTKAYKKWKKAQEKHQAKYKLGDAIAEVTKATGVDKAVKYVFGEDCGCEERQNKINSLILKTFGKKHLSTFTEDEFNYLTEQEKLYKISPDDQKKMREIHEKVFKVRSTSTCASCSFMKSIYNPLIKLLKLYK